MSSDFNFKITTPLSGKLGTVSLDLGSGSRPRNPFDASTIWGIDIEVSNLENIITADLVMQPIPFADQSVDFVTAFDFIEHIPRLIYSPDRRYPFVALMNEISRVLRPEGYFLSVTPYFPRPSAFVDPTHVNFITPNTWKYFDIQYNWAKMYGYCGSLEMIQNSEGNEHLVTLFRRL